MQMKTIQKLIFSVEMKNKLLTSLLLVFSIFGNNAIGQTIDEIIIPGATSSNNGTTWDVEFFSSTNTTTNAQNFKEIKVVQTGTKGKYLVWDATNKADWEIVMGNSGSGSWFTFCKPILENDIACNNKCTVSYYIRHIGTTAGQQSTSITLGLNNSYACAFTSGTPSFTIEATVNKVASTGIYTWIEPASGLTDSSYKIAANWSPTRTVVSTDDILVVDLAQTAATRNTTIDISNLTESINQFKIFPYNNVTFKCTANTAWTVGKATSTTGDDFIVDLNAGMRKSGSGTLEIIIPTGNTATINSKLAVATNPSGTNSGTLLFSGAGSHSIAGNVHVDGGTLSFKPSSTNTLLFNGTSQSLNGTGGTLYIDSFMNVTIGTGVSNTFTLNRSLPLYSKLTLLPNTTIVSNSPASSSSADWNAWTPHLQFKWFDKVGSKAFGELAVMPTGAAITGGSLVEILNSSKRAYRTVGIPLKNAANFSQFVDDIHLTGTVTDAANKDSFTTSCSWCKSSIFRWNENTAAWVAYTSGSSANKIDPGKGVLVFFRGARDLDHGLGDTSIVANQQIIDFKGQVQTGSLTVTGLAKTNGGVLDGANLIANPYPSTLNFRTFYEGNTANILPRYYTYDALAKNYNSWDSSVGSTPQKGGASWFQNAGGDTRYINPGAAFFVFSRNNNGSLSFTEAMKEASKRSKGKNFEVEEMKETPCNEFKMTVNYVSDTAKESDGFTLQYDLNIPEVTNDGEMYDAPKFYGGFLGLGTTTNNSQWLAVDRRTKLAEIGNTHTVPLKVAYPKTGPTDLFFTIKSCSYGNGPYKIQLVDKVLNTVEEVGDNSIYQYSINTTEEKRQDRFEVIFTAVESQLGSKTLISNNKKYIIYPNPASDGQFNVVNNKMNKIKAIEVYNAQGQLVKTENNCSNDLIPVTLQHVSSGIYTAKIVGEKGIESHTIVLP